MVTFNICTWNCTGLMSSAFYLSKMLQKENIDICGVSEHWLSAHNIGFLDSVDPSYNNMGKIENGYLKQHNSRGGVALLWKRDLNDRISYLDIDYENIIGIQMQMSQNDFIYIIEVYSPCSKYPLVKYK